MTTLSSVKPLDMLDLTHLMDLTELDLLYVNQGLSGRAL